MKVRFTPSARNQFLSALAYIRQDKPSAAVKFRDRAEKILRRLEDLPESGRLIPEFPDLPYREVHFQDVKNLGDKIKDGRFVTWGGAIEYKGTKKRSIRKQLPCLHLWRFMNIASNGDMVVCCFDYNHTIKIGNVKNRNVMDVWNGKEFNKLREDQLKGKFSKMCLQCENESYYSA